MTLWSVSYWTRAASRASPSSVLVGLAVVALTVVDGAAYLGLKTRGDVRLETQPLGHLAQLAYLVLAVAALVVGSRSASHITFRSLPTLGLVGLTVLLAGIHVLAGRADRHYLAFAAVAAQVYGLVALVATLLYPQIDPATGLNVEAAIVSTLPLNLSTIGAGLLMPLVVSYFVVLYSAFSGPVEDEESYA
ncbi:cytochrome d ubiquinol oxidase subunit II [Halorientalis regularis]|uniref:Cytochrome d ubiquinol oxidase subunit II n=1 Tax=Halorientalis regularis TaxID=660518 RepID=A0A1G7SQR2_9EURY|nr:cytochrome d ubiquinol oxidase subunit II [Halorientalis regularis]SDG24610.1 cytochrome d ubiquinol oxidase subunit II [Halorientalis regularis]